MNNVSLIGNTTKDIELQYTNTNKEFVKFTVAVQRPFKNPNGEYESDFIRCVAWHHSAIYLSNYAYKGCKVAIVGRIQTGQYENETKGTIYTTDIVCNNVTIISKRETQSTTAHVEPPVKNERQKNWDSVEVNTSQLPF